MWFIGVEVEQETSAPPPKKILDPPLRKCTYEFDAAVSSDLYPDIVQILEGVCSNFVCTYFLSHSTLNNWLLFK